jgi:hypothetical protein
VAASPETRSGDAFALDAELGTFRRGLWLLAEVSGGENLATQRDVHRCAGDCGSFFQPTGGVRVSKGGSRWRG